MMSTIWGFIVSRTTLFSIFIMPVKYMREIMENFQVDQSLILFNVIYHFRGLVNLLMSLRFMKFPLCCLRGRAFLSNIETDKKDSFSRHFATKPRCTAGSTSRSGLRRTVFGQVVGLSYIFGRPVCLFFGQSCLCLSLGRSVCLLITFCLCLLAVLLISDF